MTGNLVALRTDGEIYCPDIDAGLRERGLELRLMPDNLPEAEFAKELRSADILLACYQPVTATALAEASRLRAIIKYGVGIDAIDIAAAIEHKIPVANVPDYGARSVAEGALTLVLAVLRKLQPMMRQMHQHGWAWPEPALLGTELTGKTLGIIGCGHTGTALAQMVRDGFGVRVMGYDPELSSKELYQRGVEPCSDIYQLLNSCDVVSLHAVLNRHTYQLIGATELEAMKPSAVLVNVARGDIVDETELIKALRNGIIAGAGIDTYSTEPLDSATHLLASLLTMDNVVCSPHLTFYTYEAMRRLEIETLARCDEALDGLPLTVRSNDPRLRQQTTNVHIVE